MPSTSVTLSDLTRGFARDLHDGPLQDVFATKIRLELLARGAPAELRAELYGLVTLQGDIIRRIRGLCNGNTVSNLVDDDIRTLLYRVVRTASIGLGFEPECTIDSFVARSIDPALTNDVAFSLRECLSNVARHAAATRAAVSLTARRGHLVLEVCDDGRGIDRASIRGNGLDNLVARAKAHGGECLFASKPGGGTVVVWQVPIPQKRITRSDTPQVRRRVSSTSSRRAAMASR